MPDTNLKYTSENVETGSVFDILVGNLLAYRAEEWGWSEQDYTKISEEFADAASNDLYYLPAGNYKVSNFPVSLLPTELNIQSTEFVNLQVIADSTSAKTYWLNILNKTYYASIPNAGLSSITWNDANDIGKGADVTTIHVSNTAPTISDNGSHIWIDTSNVNTNGYASMKQWDNTISTWKDFIIPGMMDKSVYDPTGKNTDPFIYVMDKLEEVAGDYAQFIRHKNNELTLIHVTSEEKDIYNNDLLTLDQISQMFGTGGSIYEEMVNFIENETAEQFGTEEFSTQLTTIEDALNEHITNHIDDVKITSWDNKANSDHTHNLDNRVTITGNNIRDILSTEKGNMLSSQNWWYSVCYGNGKYVAVCGGYSFSNIMAYSTDGINWTQGTMPSSQDWRSVCYGNGKYIAVCNSPNIMAYSTDGISWTQGTMPSSPTWYSVCYGNGKYVAVANNSNIMAYSTDGISWTEGNMPSSKRWYSVCYGNDKFVVVTQLTNIMAYILDSEFDLLKFKESSVSASSIRGLQSICYGNGKFVALAGGAGSAQNIMAYSTDGISWTQGTLPSSQRWYSVCYGNGKYVAVARGTTTMAYSTDGISWTQGTMPIEESWYSVCYGNGKYVAIIYGSSTMAYSTNGISWTQGTMPSARSWYSVCYGNDKFVAVAYNSTTMVYSTDGISWTEGTMPSQQWYSVCYGNGKYVAIAYNSNIFAYSTDGISWTQGTMSSKQYWRSVCYGNGKYVAVGSDTEIAYALSDYLFHPLFDLDKINGRVVLTEESNTYLAKIRDTFDNLIEMNGKLTQVNHSTLTDYNNIRINFYQMPDYNKYIQSSTTGSGLYSKLIPWNGYYICIGAPRNLNAIERMILVVSNLGALDGENNKLYDLTKCVYFWGITIKENTPNDLVFDIVNFSNTTNGQYECITLHCAFTKDNESGIHDNTAARVTATTGGTKTIIGAYQIANDKYLVFTDTGADLITVGDTVTIQENYGTKVKSSLLTHYGMVSIPNNAATIEANTNVSFSECGDEIFSSIQSGNLYSYDDQTRYSDDVTGYEANDKGKALTAFDTGVFTTNTGKDLLLRAKLKFTFTSDFTLA